MDRPIASDLSLLVYQKRLERGELDSTSQPSPRHVRLDAFIADPDFNQPEADDDDVITPLWYMHPRRRG